GGAVAPRGGEPRADRGGNDRRDRALRRLAGRALPRVALAARRSDETTAQLVRRERPLPRGLHARGAPVAPAAPRRALPAPARNPRRPPGPSLRLVPAGRRLRARAEAVRTDRRRRPHCRRPPAVPPASPVPRPAHARAGRGGAAADRAPPPPCSRLVPEGR